MGTIIVLSLLILLHELGHFLTARKFGVKVEEFGIGLPPKMLTLWRRGDTAYTLNWLPLGGFVRLFGEDGDLTFFEKLNPFVKKTSFVGKPAWQRGLILVAGIIMNFLIGIVLFSIIYSVSGVPSLHGERAVVTQVVSGSPADLADINEGDVIAAFDDEVIATSDEFVRKIGDKRGQNVRLQITALLPDGTIGESSRIVEVVPRVNPPEGEGSLGVAIATIPIVTYEHKPWYLAPIYGAVEGVKESFGWGREILRGLGSLAGHLIRGQLPDGLSGPVGVWRAGEKISESAGIMGTLRFGAILSINLAIFNLLPFPGLDGGRLLFLGLEKVIGRKRVNKYENYIHMGGVMLLILLLLVVTWRDIFN
jgi:regulator of sigma E protease